jgi:hypothetical protein
VVRHTIVASIARGESLVAESAEPAPVLLQGIIEHWLALRATPASAIPKLILSEAGNFPDLARFYLEEVVLRGKELICNLLQRGVQHGEFRSVSVEHAAMCVMAPMILSMLWRHSFEPHADHPLEAGALARVHLDLLLHGLTHATPGAATARPRRHIKRQSHEHRRVVET